VRSQVPSIAPLGHSRAGAYGHAAQARVKGEELSKVMYRLIEAEITT